MDLVEGRSLRDVIRDDKPLPIDRAIRLLRPLAEALDFAHQHGVIHRDVKPTNVIIGKDDHVTLLDFGIARAIESAQQFTREGLVVGTPEYMAPEVVVGGQPGASADLYALGDRRLRGADRARPLPRAPTPPPSPSPTSTRRRPRRAPSAPTCRSRWSGCCCASLSKDPAGRFPNARSFVDALEHGPPADMDDAGPDHRRDDGDDRPGARDGGDAARAGRAPIARPGVPRPRRRAAAGRPCHAARLRRPPDPRRAAAPPRAGPAPARAGASRGWWSWSPPCCWRCWAATA